MMKIIRNASPIILATSGLIAAILSVTAAGFSKSFLEETGLPIPDMVLHLFLTRPESAFRLYGDLALTGYWRVQAIDLLLPAAYGFFLAMLFGRITADRGANAILSKAWIIPLAAAATDYAENILIALYSRILPHPGIAAGASIATLLKWSLIALSITALGLLFFRSIYVNVNNSKRQSLDDGVDRERNLRWGKKNN